MLNIITSISRSWWVYAIIAGLFLSVYAAYPQIKLQYQKGPDYQGHYAYNDIDEVAYAAYLKALIDGRPRKNDPYTGRDDSAESPQPESLFSIQFAAPYIVAIPAIIAGVSAPAAMTAAGIAAGFLTALFCFWLIWEISENRLLAFTGSLFVLCGGALFAGEGAIGEITGTGFSYPYFPFLRRYVPAVPFPVFFLLLISVWRMFISEEITKKAIWCVSGVLCFSFLVFSYFYIWTTAAAWLFILAAAVLVLRPENWQRYAASLACLGMASALPLAFYAYLLSQRADTMDNIQLLVNSHAPDLTRMPFYIGTLAVFGCLFAAITRIANVKSLEFIFAIVTALVPIAVLNQQVVTGHSLQPIHYQVFIGNYVAGLSLVLLASLIPKLRGDQMPAIPAAALAFIATVSVIWGFVECHYTVRVLDDANAARDRAYGVGSLLTEEGRKSRDPFRDTILSLSSIHSDDSPTVAPQNVLWARHQHIFAGLSWPESKERYYKQLYYQDLGPEWLERQLNSGNFVASIALFGWGRHTNRLSTKAKPLTAWEIETEVDRFREFYEHFDRSKAANPELDFLVLPVSYEVGVENLERWYERELIGEEGQFFIFRLKLRE